MSAYGCIRLVGIRTKICNLALIILFGIVFGTLNKTHMRLFPF
jgi:hypothetical protein